MDEHILITCKELDMASDIKLNDNAVVVESNVGIGTTNATWPLQFEQHGGPYAVLG